MKKHRIAIKLLLLLTAFLIVVAAGCKTQATPTPTPTPTATPTPTPTPTPTLTLTLTLTPPIAYSLPELKYRLLSNYDNTFWCDPDFYPVAREGQEEKNSLEQFPAIKADAAEFAAILQRLGLPTKADYTNEEKLNIYREHKELSYGVEVIASGDYYTRNIYNFTLRTGEGQGYRIQGTITRLGAITETARETSFNTCPICLTKGTLIDTPDGPLPVEQLREGMAVWTVDDTGKRVAAVVIETAMAPAPSSFMMVKVTLNDGRTVTASPGHPTAVGRALGDYQVGDTLDGALLTAVERVAYGGGATYDILPSGGTGLYWANGILLKSTLAAH